MNGFVKNSGMILLCVLVTGCGMSFGRLTSWVKTAKEIEGTATTTTTTTTTTQPNVFPYAWAWGEGFKANGAVRDERVTITLKRADASGIYVDATDYSHWKSAGVLSADYKDRAVACLVYVARGKAAKFDWWPTNCRSKDWKHVTTKHYGGMPEPDVGEKCGFVLISGDRKYCSNVVEFDWK